MKLTTMTTVHLTFDVQYFEDTEGGMHTGSFGSACSTLEAAVEQWRLAQVANPRRDWVIVTIPTVQTQLGKGQS